MNKLFAGCAILFGLTQSCFPANCTFRVGTAAELKTNLTSETGMRYCVNPTIYVNSDGVGFYLCNGCEDPRMTGDGYIVGTDAGGNPIAEYPGWVLQAGKEVSIPGCSQTFMECGYWCGGAGVSSGVCLDDRNWRATGTTGYESMYKRSCENEYCTETAAYRCGPGYYGRSSDGTSGCASCPSEDGATGTSAAGSTERTSCYIPSGTSFTNITGSGQWTGNSYYCD